MSRLSTFSRTAAAAVVITMAFASTPAIAARSYPVKLKAVATGANVLAGKGSPTGSGSATFIIDVSKGTICYSIRSKALVAINGVHIHAGAAGVDGQVVITMNAKRFNKPGNTCVKAASTVLGDITTNPGKYYFNIHTNKFPAGAVRGQLTGTASTSKAPTTKAPTTTAPSPKASATTTPSSKYGY